MKQWFPFTDYDFYAYLAAGGVLLAAWDFAFNGAHVITQTHWTVVQGVLAIAASYILGGVVAGFASGLVEHWLTQTILIPPTAIQLGLVTPRAAERLLTMIAAPRELSLLPVSVRNVLNERTPPADKRASAEQIFFAAHAKAMTEPVAKARLDAFQNQYGMSRNLCFSALIVSAMFIIAAAEHKIPWHYSALALVSCLLLYFRYLKFYAAFSREVLRTQFRLKEQVQ